MGQERVILDERGIRVSTVTIRIGDATYPLRGVTSVRVEPQPRSPWPLALLVLGSCIGLPDLGGLLTRGEGGPCLLPALPMILVALALLFTTRTRHVLKLGTGGDDRDALVTTDADTAHRVRSAIERALAEA